MIKVTLALAAVGCVIGCASATNAPRRGRIEYTMKRVADKVPEHNVIKTRAFKAFRDRDTYDLVFDGRGFEGDPFQYVLQCRPDGTTCVRDFTRDRNSDRRVHRAAVNDLRLGWLKDGQFLNVDSEAPPGAAALYLRCTLADGTRFDL